MRTLFSALALSLLASAAQAQTITAKLSDFQIQESYVVPVEIDGDDTTVEWMIYTPQGHPALFNPAHNWGSPNMPFIAPCLEFISPAPGLDPQRFHALDFPVIHGRTMKLSQDGLTVDLRPLELVFCK